MNAGPNIVITDELSQSRHLKLGDPFPLKTKLGTVDFHICGVAAAPGMDLVNSQFDMGRQFDQRTTGSVFGSMATAVKYFDKADEIHLVAADLEPGAEKEKVMKEVQQRVSVMGMAAGDVRAMKQKMTAAFAEVLFVVSAVPFGAMAIASLGVTNTIMASVRTRRWQLGVLRAVGLTRSQLLRLILGESALIGVVGVAMGNRRRDADDHRRARNEPHRDRVSPDDRHPMGHRQHRYRSGAGRRHLGRSVPGVQRVAHRAVVAAAKRARGSVSWGTDLHQ